jgi:hypothetical protein
MEWVHPWRLAKDTSGGGIEVLDEFGAKVNHSPIGIAFRMQQSFKPVADADHLSSQSTARNGRTHDHSIRSRDKSRTHIDSDASVRTCMTEIVDHDVPPMGKRFQSMLKVLLLCSRQSFIDIQRLVRSVHGYPGSWDAIFASNRTYCTAAVVWVLRPKASSMIACNRFTRSSGGVL